MYSPHLFTPNLAKSHTTILQSKCFYQSIPFKISTILSMFSVEDQSLILHFTLCINPPFATTPSSHGNLNDHSI
jgi:hypothetical protein